MAPESKHELVIVRYNITMRHPSIDEAFASVPREEFLRAEDRDKADIDAPIKIGYGQTNSQPSTVAKMLEWLEVEPGDKVLDVGSGSGWTSALLGKLVGGEGSVEAVEVVPELVEFGRSNCEKVGVENVRFHQARKDSIGHPEEGPYQRILVSAAAESLPDELLAQLDSPGRMVIPVKDEIWTIDKDSEGEVTAQRHWGFAFVPLV